MAVADRVVAFMNHVPSPLAARFRSDGVLARMFRPLVNRLVPIGPTWVVVRSGAAKGVRLLIDPKTEKLFWPGMHEVAVQQAISRLLKPGMTFWDIGAHIGFFTLLTSRLVGDTGHVYAFEPMDQNRQRLLAAIQMNGCKNITVHDFALSVMSGEVMLYTHKSSAMWTLVAELGGQEGRVIRCCTLDEFAASIPPPDLIKVDVEGAEVDVLRGGLHFLSTVRPRLIVEFSNDALLAAARTLLPFYTFERLAPHHWLAR